MRRSTVWTATADRDQGKTYLITEKSAADAEWWAARVLLALAKNNVDVPEGVEQMGLAGIAQVGVRSLAKLHPEDAKPLLDEMMTCVRAVPDPSRQDPATGLPWARPLAEGDIEEVATIMSLRLEVLGLHVNFSSSGVLSKLKSGTASQTSSTTQTSPPA